MSSYLLIAKDQFEPNRIVIEYPGDEGEVLGFVLHHKLGGEARVWEARKLPLNLQKPTLLVIGNKSADAAPVAQDGIDRRSEGDEDVFDPAAFDEGEEMFSAGIDDDL